MKYRLSVIRVSKLTILILLASMMIAKETKQQTASTVEPPRTADLEYYPKIINPAYSSGEGPVVLVDEAHNNFHTSWGTYKPFTSLLERDGYVIKRGTSKISNDMLQNCDIYVIADAQPPVKKTDPPTFSSQEIKTLNNWVKNGGAFFLITDHMPDPGAIAELSKSFGIEVNNGYALDKSFFEGKEGLIVFSRADGGVAKHAVTNGRDSSEIIQEVVTFAGSAFKTGPDFFPVLIFGSNKRTWMPKEYWKFPPGTRNISIKGWFQGAVADFGKGKIVFFSEAAMFTAQVFDQGKVRAGMNHPLAKDNFQLLLNVMHWLSGLLS